MTSDTLKTQFRQQAQGALGLYIAFIGVSAGLFSTLHRLQAASAHTLAEAGGLDAGYVARWCDAAYAFGYLEAEGDLFRLGPAGDAMRPEAPDSLMPLAVQSVLSAHMAERAAGLMRSGERPGESVLGERDTILPWFGPMLESNFATLFETTICPAVPVFQQADAQGGLALDLGCGNGWYLRALARHYPRLRGLGLDGFAENVAQARARAQAEGLAARLQFEQGDIHDFTLEEPADLIAMNRALHHVWERGRPEIFRWLRDNLKPGGHAVIWEPVWPAERAQLREPSRRGLSFQNLSEHVQGNHLLQPGEIAQAFQEAGMPAEIHLFAGGNEALIVARR
ncbi:MAG: class I SAM-dependent methyltransferase [Betaproteobacteria bacterium]|nr:class I SAM-dependent methyltransferase [Betaproteobacteria bacterium]